MSGRNTILLVEDNPDDVELTKRAFGRSKIINDIAIARDGVEALEYLLGGATSKAAPLPEVVLLDLKLPKVDGLEVLRRLRADARTRRLPVVVLTSSTEESDIVRSYDFGANSFVKKPVDFLQFVDAAHHLGLYWLLLNTRPPR
jgi:two-component system response regulator